jgi:hypothetical protein
VKRPLLPQSRASRAVAALVTATALTVTTAGCEVFSPTQTDIPYVPADGVQADMGQVAVRDLVLVLTGTGGAMVSGGLVNAGKQSVTVQFAPQQQSGTGSGSEVQLGPGQGVNLSEKGLQLSGVSAKPGTLVPLSVTTSAAGTTLLNVPAVQAAGYYATVTPGPVSSQ